MQGTKIEDNSMEELTIGPSTGTNVANAMVGDTGQINVLAAVEEDEPSIEDVEEDVDAVVVEDAVDKEVNRRKCMLPCRRRMQVLLARQRNRVQVQPQCPLNRETEWTLSWPAQAAGGAVGMPWASRPKGNESGLCEGKTDKRTKL